MPTFRYITIMQAEDPSVGIFGGPIDIDLGTDVDVDEHSIDDFKAALMHAFEYVGDIVGIALESEDEAKARIKQEDEMERQSIEAEGDES